MLRGGCEGRRRMFRRDFEAILNVDELTERKYFPSSTLNRALTFDFAPALRIILAGGSPRMSQILQICSASLRPLKSGWPVCISTRIHPRLHISIGNEYAPHSSTSGDLV